MGVVTVARSDYGIYQSVLKRIQADPDLRLMLFVGGMHLSPEFGLTVRAIERDGYPIVERIEMLLSSDSPEGVSKAIGLGVIGFAQAFARTQPDMLIVLGDRFEMFAAAAAALPFNIPIAHIHGGEATFGAIDEALRHSITKMSHLHFAATQAYADRIIRMGEAPWRVTVSGAPALDAVNELLPVDVDQFEQTYQVRVSPAPLLFTYHPATLDTCDTEAQLDAIFGALNDAASPIIFTDPNADMGGRAIRDRIVQFISTHDRAWHVPNFGARGYYDALRVCAAMIGNSSSGLIEAPSFHLPVINIGARQAGRVRAANVIDVDCDRAAIMAAIHRALSPEFRASWCELINPYGDGHAAERIVAVLKTVDVNDRLIQKVFYDTELAR
jgi:UDP-hydrolysing UDP-N-acetyl-D-glucosamine 2-epimerase